ncbi:uncharacterized protein LOC127288693 isoform X2 [Leptopilina boulardi]|uniref:uncharacterized protein LOC127288693 isoform X2 n=1 Tax=Leptopilina boulardi TaxID=63433 RepID=UPI0021F6133B|nr:uncharacterized protein LOC127288693 isoform X2 [Leptopilina boulardi]
MIRIVLCCLILTLVSGEISVNGIKQTNILGGAEQHASFSFVRPGLTQTSFAFHGPSSHQTFSSSVGNPHLIHKVQPNVAQALKYKNPGLGYLSNVPISTTSMQLLSPYYLSQNFAPIGLSQQVQQQFPFSMDTQTDSIFQDQFTKHLAFKQAQLQNFQIPEQMQLQQEQSSQNLLGIAYSVAPSVARVKVSGNGYKFDF